MANQYRSVLASGSSGTGGDALPAEVLSGKTFTNDNGSQTGTMTNNGAVTQTLAAGASYTIPEGYHNGSGTVTASDDIFSSYSMVAVGDSSSPTISCQVGDIIIGIGASAANTSWSVTGGTILDEYPATMTAVGTRAVAVVATSTSVSMSAGTNNPSKVVLRKNS